MSGNAKAAGAEASRSSTPAPSTSNDPPTPSPQEPHTGIPNTGISNVRTGNPKSSNPRTGKARALGKELRALREESGLSLRKLSIDMGRDPGALSRWETGERTPKPTDVAQILTMLGIAGDRYDEIIAMTRGTSDSGYVANRLPEQSQQLAALLECERAADTITEVSPLLIPGLLQTSEYIRAIMSAGTVPKHEVETRIAVRLGRRDVIARRDPARLISFLGEAALRQVVGSTEVMVDQLQYLLHTTQFRNVDLRVIPFTSGWHPGLEGSFTLINSERANPVVHVENRRSGLFFRELLDVEAYRRAAEIVSHAALSPNESTRLIKHIAGEIDS